MFCKVKETVRKTKQHPTEWENVFINPTADRGVISKIWKTQESRHQNNKPIKTQGTDLNRKFSREESLIAEIQ